MSEDIEKNFGSRGRKNAVLKIVSVVLMLVWMSVIFAYSAKNAATSTQESKRLGRMLGRLVVSDWNEWSPEQQDEFASRWDHPVRKAAHFTEYTILGILIMNTFLAWKTKKGRAVLLSFVSGTFYAATDEFHQTFVPGRAGKISDVGIDACGVLAGTLIFLGLYILHKKIRGQAD